MTISIKVLFLRLPNCTPEGPVFSPTARDGAILDDYFEWGWLSHWITCPCPFPIFRYLVQRREWQSWKNVWSPLGTSVPRGRGPPLDPSSAPKDTDLQLYKTDHSWRLQRSQEIPSGVSQQSTLVLMPSSRRNQFPFVNWGEEGCSSVYKKMGKKI